LPSSAVFIQLLCGFELASSDPLVVGINMVQPEDWRAALANYRLQMQMVQALHALYPKVHITLHAGELGPGMVPPDDLRFHIRSAVEEGHAELWKKAPKWQLITVCVLWSLKHLVILSEAKDLWNCRQRQRRRQSA